MIATTGQDIIIALDSAANWEEDFDQAVIAATSLYFYAQRQQMQVQLWTAATDLVKGEKMVLETLAATNSGDDSITKAPNKPLIWLTPNEAIANLPNGSRWQNTSTVNWDYPGIIMQSDRLLQPQLQTGY